MDANSSSETASRVLQYDEAGTAQLATQKKYIQFQKWAESNGIYAKKMKYPALFKAKGAQPDE